jgi:hypothetical protein
MKTTIKQRRQWAANALVWAAELPDSADRDTLLQIAREHLQAIDGEEGRPHPAENLRVFPSGIW